MCGQSFAPIAGISQSPDPFFYSIMLLYDFFWSLGIASRTVKAKEFCPL
jgi:hypothetical protein